MTQVTQEEMRMGLDNLEVKLMEYFSGLVGRIQTLKESEDGARHVVEALHQGNLELRTRSTTTSPASRTSSRRTSRRRGGSYLP